MHSRNSGADARAGPAGADWPVAEDVNDMTISNATLTSLAILKVNVDRGTDYLQYLRPFVSEFLFKCRPESITEESVAAYVLAEYGLVIPDRTIKIVLKRLSRQSIISREHGAYQITGQLEDPGIESTRVQARRNTTATINGIIEFARERGQQQIDEQRAAAAICAFLARFDIPCLKAYLRGTTIPAIEANDPRTDVVLVSDYVIHISGTDPARFDSFMVLVQGHMLANALLCPDLNPDQLFNDVTFYLDTPLIVRLLGLEGRRKGNAGQALVRLLGKLGGNIAVFSHSRDELERVVRGAADGIDSPTGRGAIVLEARRKGTTRSDLIMLLGQLDARLGELGVTVRRTPTYIDKYQIDENVLAEVLDDEVSYYNERAKEFDINSVRSVFVLRASSRAWAIEKCKAILVTSNSGFADAAWKFGQEHEPSQGASSVISDVSLANVSWLKCPVGAPEIPRLEVMAFSYAALQPSNRLLERYLTEIEKLEANGQITSRDHALLRISPNAYSSMVSLTHGDGRRVNLETVTETLRRTEEEIATEKDAALGRERTESERLRDEAYARRDALAELRKQEYWRGDRIGKTVERGVTTLILMASLLGFSGSVWWVFQKYGTASVSETIGLVGSVLLGAASVATAWVSLHERTRISSGARGLWLKRSGRYQVLDELVRAEESAVGRNGP